MSTILQTPTLLLRLRSETHPEYEALEQRNFNQALITSTLTAAKTAHFLVEMRGFSRPCEITLPHHMAALSPVWEMTERVRVHLILQDLEWSPADFGLLLCLVMLLHTRPKLLSAVYVLAGSSLGRQVIAWQLAQAGITLRAYFTNYGARTEPRWKTFCRRLTEAALTDPEPDEVMASARLTFQRLDQWISQP